MNTSFELLEEIATSMEDHNTDFDFVNSVETSVDAPSETSFTMLEEARS